MKITPTCQSFLVTEWASAVQFPVVRFPQGAEPPYPM